MSWIKLSMKFPGTCIVCNEKINAGEAGLWQKGAGVKHEKCAETGGLKCMICGGSAGCPSCEFGDICNPDLVSRLCVCRGCFGNKDAFSSYQQSAAKKFPLLNLKI